jgi:hypothetical protein
MCHSGGERNHNRLGGAGFGGTGCQGNEAVRRRSRLYLTVKLHKSLSCHPTLLIFVQRFAVFRNLRM